MNNPELIVLDTDTPKHCPSCFAANSMAHSCLISWDEEKKAYLVEIELICHYQDYHEDISSIPVIIGINSTCSCGSTLSLGDHSISKQKDGELLLKATYICKKCQKKKSTLFNFIKDLLKSLWSSTKKVEIGPKGVVYEKN